MQEYKTAESAQEEWPTTKGSLTKSHHGLSYVLVLLIQKNKFDGSLNMMRIVV